MKSDCNGKCDVGEIRITGDSFGWKGPLHSGKYGDQCGRGAKVFCCKAGNIQSYLDICTWTKCNEECPSDKPHLKTTDSGGPKSNSRCSVANPSPGGGGTPFDPTPIPGRRKLCCPKKDLLENCKWKSGKYCSESCGLNQITIDTDPQGLGGRICDNGRKQSYCCDPPGGTSRPFTPFNIDNLFPPDIRPDPASIPQYDLVSFDGALRIEQEDPNIAGVAFFLIAGSSTAVTSMKKRDNPGLEFLECPDEIHSQQHIRLPGSFASTSTPKNALAFAKAGLWARLSTCQTSVTAALPEPYLSAFHAVSCSC